MRIWFNHWFSSVYQIIRMMKEGSVCPLEVIGSNRKETTVYKSMCDEWYVEPDGGTEEEYVEFCLDFCREHRIDVFAPRRGLTGIAMAQDRFSEIGVKLLVGVDGRMAKLLDNKTAAYEMLREAGFDCIPPYRETRSLEEFLVACEEMKEEGGRVCYKLAEDEGARSFRVIDERVTQSRALLEKPGFKVCMAHARMVMEQYDFSIPVLVMPYLEGPEISADCLNTPGGKLIIPRYKNIGRYSEIRFEDEVMALCGRLMDAVGATLPVNVQFRMHHGRPILLEINPRMSGGVQLSCEATGVNLPALALNQLLDHETPWRLPEEKRLRVAHVEQPVRLI